MEKNRIAQVLAVAALFMVTACAQQPQTIGKETWDDDFANDCRMVCVFISSTIGCSIDNHSNTRLEVWIEQTVETDSAMASRKTRLYQGNARTIRVEYKIQPIDRGIERIAVRIKGDQGTIIRRQIK